MKNLNNINIGSTYLAGPVPPAWTLLTLNQCNVGDLCSLGGTLPKSCGTTKLCIESPTDTTVNIILTPGAWAGIIISSVFVLFSFSASIWYYFRNRNTVITYLKLVYAPIGSFNQVNG